MKVKYVSHHGDDLLVVNAARKSFGMGYTEFLDNTKEPRTPRGRTDEHLLLDLARDGHLLPFRHPHITISCDAPIPVARQLGKHQVGLEWSEISRRYKTKGIEFYRIGNKWRSKPEDVRQGSGELLNTDTQHALARIESNVIRESINSYESALSLGASPEQARFLLPQSMMVEWVWTGSLLALFHLVKMRSHADTQQETREFVQQVDKIVEELYPYSWKALKQV